jgi:ABC-type Mn2+/Zn2+ transport system ATPase subunit
MPDMNPDHQNTHHPIDEDSPARLEFDGVTLGYGDTPILSDVSFQIPHGARVAVVGPNGAGKSTLFKAMVGLLPLWKGNILIHGLPLGHHRDCVAYIPQREEIDWTFPVSVRDVVMMGRYGAIGWLKWPALEDDAFVENAMKQMDIAGLANRPIGDLSGGQQQRVFLARALAQQPHILLMDEPFTAVDFSTQEATLRLLDDLKQQCVTVMVSTHDLNLARDRFDLVILLNHRLVAYGEPHQVFTEENIRTAFGHQVLFVNGAAVVDQCCGEDHDEAAR